MRGGKVGLERQRSTIEGFGLSGAVELDKRSAKIVVRVGEIALFLDGAAVPTTCFMEAAAFGEQRSEVVHPFGEAWREFDGAATAGFGLVESALPSQESSKIIVGLDEPRVEGKRLAQKIDRRVR